MTLIDVLTSLAGRGVLTIAAMIGLTGANGRLGRAIAQRLSTTPSGVVALSRSPQTLSAAHPALLTRRADFDDPAGLRESLRGIERLLIISTPDANDVRRDRQRSAIEAAREAGVRHALYLSFLVTDARSPFPAAAAHADTEAALRGSGMRWTVLRPSMYLDAVSLVAPDVKAERVIRAPAGAGRASFISRADLADICVRALREGLEGTYTLTGREALGYGEIADVIARELGEPVRYEAIDEDEYRARARALGPALDMFVAIWRTIREGWFEAATEDAARLLGRAPETVQDYVRSHRTELA